MRMRIRWLRKVSTAIARGAALGAVLAGAVSVACTPKPAIPPEKPTGPPLPMTPGSYDCAAPATWKTTNFAALVPAVQRALANDDAQGALTVLLSSHYDEEVTCVAAYIHDESVKQAATATDKDLAQRRVAATTAWIDQQSAHQLTVTNFGGEAH